jgi:hypothetical protein
MNVQLILLPLAAALSCVLVSCAGPGHYVYDASRSTMLVSGKAVPRDDAPAPVRRAIEAGNRISTLPYRIGGGHRVLEDTAYDCSGMVGYLLQHAGLLRGSATSHDLRHYGQSGEGRHITVWAKKGHAFIIVDGLRMDTSGNNGPRWNTASRSLRGFRARHPAGL